MTDENREISIQGENALAEYKILEADKNYSAESLAMLERRTGFSPEDLESLRNPTVILSVLRGAAYLLEASRGDSS